MRLPAGTDICALENAFQVNSSEALVRLIGIAIATRQELVNLRVELVSGGEWATFAELDGSAK